MKRQMRKLVNKGAQSLKKIENKDIVSICFHEDSDGIAAATLLTQYLKECVGIDVKKYVGVPSSTPVLTPKITRSLISSKASIVIIADVAVLPQNLIEKIAKKSFVLVVDHHDVEETPEGDNILYLNPRKLRISSSDVPPASYLVYQMCHAITDMSAYSWIAALGAIGDWSVSNTLDLFDDVKEKYPFLFKGVALINQETLQDSSLGEVLEYIDAARKFRIKSSSLTIINSLLSCSNKPHMLVQQEVPEMQELMEIGRQIEKDIDRIMTQHTHAAEFYPDSKLIVYQLDTRFDLKSHIANLLKTKYPDWIIFVSQLENELMTFSLRCQNIQLNLPDIMDKAMEQLDSGRSGGHPDAVGGAIEPELYSQLLSILLMILKERDI